MNKLSDLYEFQYEIGNNNPDNGGKCPIYCSNGIIWGYNEYNNEDSPVIGHIGLNCGVVVFVKGKHFVTYNGVVCKAKEDVNKKYAYYTLVNSRMKDRVRVSAQPFVSYDLLNDITINLPSEKEQCLIGNLLWNIDEMIEKNNKINEKLEKLTKILYEYWFVQFNFPNENKRPIISRIFALISNLFRLAVQYV